MIKYGKMHISFGKMQMKRKWKVDGWLFIWAFGSFRLLTYIYIHIYICVCSRSIFKLGHINNSSCDVLVHVTQIWEMIWSVVYPIISKVSSIQGGAGFRKHPQYEKKCKMFRFIEERSTTSWIEKKWSVTSLERRLGLRGIIPKWPNCSNKIYPDVLYNHALQIITWKCWLFEWDFGHHSCFFQCCLYIPVSGFNGWWRIIMVGWPEPQMVMIQ
jgi:hypothetical protein